MDTLHRILELLNKNGNSQKALTDFLGLSKNTFTNWKSGNNNSYKKYISEIAEFFGVSTDYLLCKTDDPTDYNDGDLIANLSGPVLDNFNGDVKKTLDFQKAVDRDAMQEQSNVTYLDNKKIHLIPLYESVSAGFGAYACSDVIDYIPLFIKNPFEVKETICITIKGDSMSPKIENGDTAVVHKQTSVDSGSIAVILVDGEEGYIKKVVYGSDWVELISLNPDYPTRRFEGESLLRLSVVGLVKQIIKQI